MDKVGETVSHSSSHRYLLQKKILVIGTANSTRKIIEPTSEHIQSDKCLLPSNCYFEQTGGGGFNYAARLLSLGIDVIPILPIANDMYGLEIKKSLILASKNGHVDFDPNLVVLMDAKENRTPSSTIIKDGINNKIYVELSKKIQDNFPDHCHKVIKTVTQDLDFIFIGHIHSDFHNNGSLTKEIINSFYEKHIPIYANFGLSQIVHGYDSWKNILLKIDFLQLNIFELKIFFNQQKVRHLSEALDLLREYCTIIITCGEFGALVQVKKSQKISYIRPYELLKNEIIDTDGAGDAFGAALLSCLIQKYPQKGEIPVSALNRANICAAHSCTTDFSSNIFPDLNELNKFSNYHVSPLIENFNIIDGNQILNTIDSKFFS